MPSFSLFFIGHAHANCLNALFLAILQCSIYNWITSCYPLIFNWLYRLRNVYKFSPRRNSIYAARTLKVLTFKRILESAHDLADEDNAFHFDLSEARSLRKRKAFKISDIGRRIWKARRNRSGRRINLKWNFFKTKLSLFFGFISRLSDIPSKIYFPIYTFLVHVFILLSDMSREGKKELRSSDGISNIMCAERRPPF